MPGVARDFGTDIAKGPIIEGAPDVFVEGDPIVRVGDLVADRGAIMAEGSPNVFVNNIPICREGDLSTRGQPATGSFTVFAN